MRKVLVVNEPDSPGDTLVSHLNVDGEPVASYTLPPTKSVVVEIAEGDSVHLTQPPLPPEPEES